MSRPDHIVNRFQTTMGDSWWWRRYADLVDRKVLLPGGKVEYKPFNYEQASRLLLTKRNKRKYKDRLDKGLEISRLQPLKVKQPNAEAPPKLQRPPELTRQQHRRLYREACKLAGVPWRTERLFKTPRRERGRNWKDLSPEALAELEAQWAEFIKGSLEIK